MDIPDVASIRERQMHTVRAVAGSSPEIREVQLWIMEAMDPSVDNEQLRNPGRFQRLDIMIATT
eukprot:732095-Pyramimonas_sp.AAC.1